MKQRNVAVVCALLLIAACTGLGFQANTFNERAAVAISSATAAVDTTSDLLAADRISADDAENILAQLDNLKAGIDVARVVHDSNEAAGDERLTAVLAGLSAISSYLKHREAP